MNFSSGNSGASLRQAVVKIGPYCQQEGSYCQFLGKDVCPEVYALIPEGYVMEALSPSHRHPELLLSIERLLEEKVWCREALPSSSEIDFRDRLAVYGVTVPDWAMPTEFCLTHGDPTQSNCMYRGAELILGDPRPPRDYVPQCKEIDMGKILQSLFGWEYAAYGGYPMHYIPPAFFDDELLRIKAMFWCGAAVARIEHLERSRANRSYILEWCGRVRTVCNV